MDPSTHDSLRYMISVATYLPCKSKITAFDNANHETNGFVDRAEEKWILVAYQDDSRGVEAFLLMQARVARLQRKNLQECDSTAAMGGSVCFAHLFFFLQN